MAPSAAGDSERRRLRRAAGCALALLLVTGCAGEPRATLPPVPARPSDVVSDPARQAVLSAAYAFGEPGRLAGRPAAAARAVADLEWLAVALPQDQRWIGVTPLLFGQLAAGRAEVRNALGIPQDATAAEVTRRYYAAADALEAGRRAEAAAALGGEDALARLSSLPRLPRAAAATQLAQFELNRIVTEDPGS